MRVRQFFIALGLCACSVSKAEEPLSSKTPIATIATIVIASTPAIAKISESPVVKVRRVKRKSRLEAEWFSKISVSEGNFSRFEAQALLQALEDMRGNDSLLEAMYKQSAHITKRLPYTDPRQVWISNLPMKGTEVPIGWIECTGKNERGRPLPSGCTGNWKPTLKIWQSFSSYTTKLYWSGIVPNVVDGVIAQWGGDMDYWRGVDRGFCPLRSPGTDNTYWGEPSRNEGKCLPINNDMVKRSRAMTVVIANAREKRKHLIPTTISARVASGNMPD